MARRKAAKMTKAQRSEHARKMALARWAKRKALLAGALLLCAVTVSGDEAGRDVLVLSLAASADLASTHYALARCATCREGNPLMGQPAGAVAIKAAGVAAVAWGCGRLRRAGHPRAAKVLLWGVAGLWVGAAGWNMHQAGGQR